MRGLFLICFLMLGVTLAKAQNQPSWTPIFKHKKDAVAYYNIPDSLYEERREFLNVHKHIVRTIYQRHPSFTPYTRLPSIVNLDSIIKISIAGKRRLPDSLYLNKNLAELELVNCKISRLPKKLMNQQSMTRLVINNNFPKRRLKLPKNSTITHLTIRGDENHKLPRSYKNFNKLGFLFLQRDNLEKFPNTSGCDNLLRLDLNGNKIKVVPASIGKCGNLISLNVNNNRVSRIEPGIEKLRLLELSLYGNDLPEVPPMLYTMTSLRMIDLYDNHIRLLAPDVANWKNLGTLYVAHNDLRELPEEIGQLKNLRELYIHHNTITKLPASIGDLDSLHVLRMNNNLISEWPKGVTKLKALTNLDFSYNELTLLPITELDYKNLKILVIERNPWDPSLKKQISAWTKALRKGDTVVLE